MWILIILIVVIIIAILEQISVNKVMHKSTTYIIPPSNGPKYYINPYTGNKMLICSNNFILDQNIYSGFSKKIKPKKLIINQVSKPLYKFFNGVKHISYITPLTDLCGLAEPILKTVLRPSLKENYYTIYTNDDIESIMFDNKICIFNN